MAKHVETSGFSLVEISLALMVVAVGLLALIQLFPAGRRAGFDATAETRVGAFADEVFNQFYAEAAAQTNPAAFAGVFNGRLDIDLGGSHVALNRPDWTTVEYPPNSNEYLRYICDAGVMQDELVATSKLSVVYGRVGGIPQYFYTEIYNYGL